MAVLGLVQGFSILPGVSRSGTTLTVLLMRVCKGYQLLKVLHGACAANAALGPFTVRLIFPEMRVVAGPPGL